MIKKILNVEIVVKARQDIVIIQIGLPSPSTYDNYFTKHVES